MRVMSINIRFENDQDEHPWSESESISSKKSWMSLNHLFFGTQEGRQPQINDLGLSSKDIILIDDHGNWIEERMYPCLFINKDHFEVHASGDIWLSETPDVAGSKSFDSAFLAFVLGPRRQQRLVKIFFLPMSI